MTGRIMRCLTGLLALVGCDGRGPTRHPESTTPVASVETPMAVEVDGRSLAAKPGPAYFATDGGLVVLDSSGEFSMLEQFDRHSTVEQVELVEGQDARVYAWIEGRGLFDLRPPSIEQVYSLAQRGPKAFAVTSQGIAWAHGAGVLVRIEDGSAEPIDLEAWGNDRAVHSSLVLDPQGRVWVSLGTTVVVQQAQGWRPIELPHEPLAGSRFEAWTLAVNPAWDGVYAVCPSAILRIDAAGSFEFVRNVPTTPVEAELALAFSSADYGIAYRENGDLVRLSTTGLDVIAEPKITANGVVLTSASVDANARTWLATESGIEIRRPGVDDRDVTWPVGSVPELAGRVRDFVIVDGGPSLPEVRSVPTASLRGRALHRGTPVANTQVELCRAIEYFGPRPATPCANSPTRHAAETGDDGTFAFHDLPIGPYDLAFSTSSSWTISRSPVEIRERETKSEDFDAADMFGWR